MLKRRLNEGPIHSKSHATDKLHIIVDSYIRDLEGQVEQQDDPADHDYGSLVESKCGLKGILIKTDVDAYRADDFDERMGLVFS